MSEGMKSRFLDSDYWRALRANPTSVPFEDVSLQAHGLLAYIVKLTGLYARGGWGDKDNFVRQIVALQSIVEDAAPAIGGVLISDEMAHRETNLLARNVLGKLKDDIEKKDKRFFGRILMDAGFTIETKTFDVTDPEEWSKRSSPSFLTIEALKSAAEELLKRMDVQREILAEIPDSQLMNLPAKFDAKEILSMPEDQAKNWVSLQLDLEDAKAIRQACVQAQSIITSRISPEHLLELGDKTYLERTMHALDVANDELGGAIGTLLRRVVELRLEM